MSAYQVNKICHLILHDTSFRSAMLADVATAIADFDLTEDERTALVSGDVAKLYELGTSSFLLLTFPRFGICGLGFESYNQRMRSIADKEHKKFGSVPY